MFTRLAETTTSTMYWLIVGFAVAVLGVIVSVVSVFILRLNNYEPSNPIILFCYDVACGIYDITLTLLGIQ
jgi:hypothetical protein